MSAGSRIILIEYMRGLAALGVAWFHLTNTYHDAISSTGNLGWLGVEMFFVISGFVVPLSLFGAYSRHGRHALLPFFIRRIVRIEPPYLLSIALVIILNFLAAKVPSFHGIPQHYSMERVALHIAYLIPFSRLEWLQPVYWTLAYEFGFYLATCLAYPLLLVPGRGGAACMMLLSGGVATHMLSPLLLLFAMGIAAFRAQVGLDRPGMALAQISIAAAVMLSVGVADAAIMGMATSSMILFNNRIAVPTGHLGKAFGFLGSISFSLYLIHVPIGGRVVNFGSRWISEPANHLVLSLLALGICLIAATAYWRWVERPCIAASQRIAARFSRLHSRHQR